MFAQSIGCGYTLEPLGEAVLTSHPNLKKKKKNRYTLAYPSFAIDMLS